MIRKLISGGLVAAVAAAALMLVSTGTTTQTADAAVNGISVAPATIPAGVANTSVATVDVDPGAPAAATAVNLLVSSGTFAALSCTDTAGTTTLSVTATCATNTTQAAATAATVAGATVVDLDPAGGITAGVVSVWVGPNAAAGAGDINTVNATIAAPATGPATISLTAIQGTSVKSADITVLGAVSEVTVVANTAENGTGTAGNGIVYNVLPAVGSTIGFSVAGTAGAQLVANAKDSAGKAIAGAAAVFTTTAGTIANPASITNAVGNAGVTAGAGVSGLETTLSAGATGLSGVEATVTASVGGKAGTTKVKFGGDPASCTITTDPTTLQPGAAATVTIDIDDASGNAVPDGIPGGAPGAAAVVSLAQANASVGGAGAAVVGAPGATSNGISKSTVIAATTGPVALGANVGVGANAPVNCTGTLSVAGSVVPPGGNPPAGDGTVTGVVPGKLSIGNGAGTLAELGASAAAQGCNNAVLWLNAPGGGLIGFFPTASLSAPNAAANAAYGTAGYNGGILIDCN